MPRAARDGVQGLHGDRVKIRLTAPAVGGAANESLLRFLARLTRIPRGRMRIVLGVRDRSKTVLLESPEPEKLVRALRSSVEAAVDKRADRT
jgi:uncharacterized protein (TIGR00251 family)